MLRVLTTSRTNPWRLCTQSTPYVQAQQFIRGMLDLTRQNRAMWECDDYSATLLDGRGITHKIVRIAQHQRCSVAYIVRSNPHVGTRFFIVYGLERDDAYDKCESGPLLDEINTRNSQKYCPKGVQSLHVEPYNANCYE